MDKKLIILKKYTNKEKLILIPLSEEELNLNNDEIINLINNKILTTNIIKIVHFAGFLKELKNVENFVHKFKQSRYRKKEKLNPHYRCYTLSVERQLKNIAYINICEDADMSWESAIIACGSKIGIVVTIEPLT